MTQSMKLRIRRGAMLPLIAVCLIILFVAAALAIDIARVHVTRAELRTATDAAAQAAAETLSRKQNKSDALLAAKDLAESNLVAGKPLQLRDQNVVFGRSSPQADGSFLFAESEDRINSVRVIGQRTKGSLSGPVHLMFGPVFGVKEFEPVQVCTATRLDRDIALVLDVSGSMRSFGRFDALKNAVSVFLSEIQKTPDEELVSLSVYSSSARKLVPITNDMSLIDRQLRRQRASGTTAIGEGLRVGLGSVKNDPRSRELAEKTVIVMTDGNHNRGISPLTIAAQAKRDKITVHTITFSQGANQSLMRQVAQQTGGIHLHANSNRELVEVFKEIAAQLPVLITE